MTSAPIPGISEADLFTKIATSVLQGLKKSNQIPSWPDTHESLLELHAVLEEWDHRATITTVYARFLVARRIASQAPGSSLQVPDSAWEVRYGDSADDMRRLLPVTNLAGYPLILTNVKSPRFGRIGPVKLVRSYISTTRRDIKKILYGSPSLVARLSPSRSRKVKRRGLRTIMAAYCPELLEQFESATSARSDWAVKHMDEFKQWFAESRTDEEVSATLDVMTRTESDLREATEQLRQFIATNFPMSSRS